MPFLYIKKYIYVRIITLTHKSENDKPFDRDLIGPKVDCESHLAQYLVFIAGNMVFILPH